MSELYIGIMSGTSLDAVDTVLVDLAEGRIQILATHQRPIADAMREALKGLAEPGHGELDRVCRLDVQLGDLYGGCVRDLLRNVGTDPEQIRAIGSHGQTVHHSPRTDVPFTLQIGDPNRIAEATGITTVADFRRRDIAAGGEGAPLLPAFHHVIFPSPTENRVIVNIGGMANITLLPSDSTAAVTGFDTGPGNVLLDSWALAQLGTPIDRDGVWATTGEVDVALLERLAADPYFHRRPPKSTGRDYFHLHWLERALESLTSQPTPVDVQATLSELTATTIANDIRAYAAGIQRVLVCGGGVHNRDLIRRLARALDPCPVESTEAYGLHPDWVEATAFAWLARQALQGHPANLPSVTGARHPVVLGGIYLGTRT